MTTTATHTTTCVLCDTPIPAGQERPLDGECASVPAFEDTPDAVIGDCCHDTHIEDCATYRHEHTVWGESA